MIKRVEKVMKAHVDNKKMAEDLSNEIEVLTSQLEAEDAAAEAAAEAGDLAGYEEKAAAANKTRARLHVAEAQHRKAARHADVDEVKAAWVDQRKAYDKEFEECMAAVESANVALAKAIRAVMDQQRSGFTLRQQLAEMAGISTDGVTLNNNFPMKTLSLESVNAVQRYLMQIALFDNQESASLGMLAMNHKV